MTDDYAIRILRSVSNDFRLSYCCLSRAKQQLEDLNRFDLTDRVTLDFLNLMLLCVSQLRFEIVLVLESLGSENNPD